MRSFTIAFICLFWTPDGKVNKKVYYLSERDYASNLWSFDPATNSEQQITKHAKFDVKSLDACKDAIV